MKDDIKQFTDMLQDKEFRTEIVNVIQESRSDISQIVSLVKDTLGYDIDNIIDELIKYGARKTFVAYVAFQDAGFNKKEAMQLTLNLREQLVASLNK